jgi:mono/diheme cytochrome c family protein
MHDFSRQWRLALATTALLATPVLAEPRAAFVARCAMCHQATGEGLAGQFPRLAGRAATIAQGPDGRRYMAQVVLWGLTGPIEIDGSRISSVMPGMASMADAEIAEILSHAVTLGKPAKPARPFKPAEIAAVRAAGRVSMADNAALRATLAEKGVVK